MNKDQKKYLDSILPFEAIERYKQDNPIFEIYPDGTEGQIENSKHLARCIHLDAEMAKEKKHSTRTADTLRAIKHLERILEEMETEMTDTENAIRNYEATDDDLRQLWQDAWGLEMAISILEAYI